MTKQKFFKLAFFACCFSLSTFASANQQNTTDTPMDTDKKEIIIINYVTFPILDESIEGIKKEISNNFDDTEVEFKVLNANADSSILAGMVNEVVAQKPDIIIPVSTPVTTDVLSNAPADQQIVFSTVTTPEATGYTDDLPNVTGVTDLVDYSANFDLMLKLFPNTKTIGMVYTASEASAVFGWEKSKELAKQNNIDLIDVSISNSSEVISAVRNLEPQIDLLYIGSDITVSTSMPGIASSEFGKPVFASDNLSVQEGALAAVSVDYVQLGKTAGEMAVEVLNGKPAGEIDNVIFVGDDLAINYDTAKKLNYEFPKWVSEKATKKYGQPEQAQTSSSAYWFAIVLSLFLLAGLWMLISGRREH